MIPLPSRTGRPAPPRDLFTATIYVSRRDRGSSHGHGDGGGRACMRAMQAAMPLRHSWPSCARALWPVAALGSKRKWPHEPWNRRTGTCAPMIAFEALTAGRRRGSFFPRLNLRHHYDTNKSYSRFYRPSRSSFFSPFNFRHGVG